MKRLHYVDVPPDDLARLRAIAQNASLPPRVRKRAFVLLAVHERADSANAMAEKLTDHRIAALVGVCADTVRSTVRRYLESGLACAVFDKPFVRKPLSQSEQKTSQPDVGHE